MLLLLSLILVAPYVAHSCILVYYRKTIKEKLSLDQVASEVARNFPPQQYKELEKTKVIRRSFRSVFAPSVFTGSERSSYYVADRFTNYLIACVYST